MHFNADLLDIIAESQFGFTVSDSITQSTLYKYFSNPKSTQYNACKLTATKFLTIGVNDDLFVEYACLSVETALWLREAYFDLVTDYPEDIVPWTRMELRTSLYLINHIDDRQYRVSPDMLEDESASDIFYAFVSMEQLRDFHSEMPKSILISKEIICTTIGRLDVMLFLNEHYPKAFAKVRKSPAGITDMKYTNKYGERSVETFEWLVANKLVKLTKDDFVELCNFQLGIYCCDDSIIQWLLINHLPSVRQIYAEYRNDDEDEEDYKLAWFWTIFENCNARTLQMYLEKVDSRLPISILGKRIIENEQFLHAYISENNIGA